MMEGPGRLEIEKKEQERRELAEEIMRTLDDALTQLKSGSICFHVDYPPCNTLFLESWPFNLSRMVKILKIHQRCPTQLENAL